MPTNGAVPGGVPIAERRPLFFDFGRPGVLSVCDGQQLFFERPPKRLSRHSRSLRNEETAMIEVVENDERSIAEEAVRALRLRRCA